MAAEARAEEEAKAEAARIAAEGAEAARKARVEQGAKTEAAAPRVAVGGAEPEPEDARTTSTLVNPT